MTHRAIRWAVFALVTATAGTASAERSLEEYRYFRALSIDLLGRIPTPSEITSFEDLSFDQDAWIDAQLQGSGYVDRLERIYMDALRLQVGDTFRYTPSTATLRRYSVLVKEADGTTRPEWVYFRRSQRRAMPETDRRFCFTEADTGQTYPANRFPEPETPTKAVPRSVFDQRTAKVRPYWLYRDYRAAAPNEHYSSASFRAADPRFVLELPTDRKGPATSNRDSRLLIDADGTPTTDVHVCKEEAQAAPTATVVLAGSSVNVSCTTELGALHSSSCGCGRGLEWCMFGASFSNVPAAAVIPTLQPLGPAPAFEYARKSTADYWNQNFDEEARMFLRMVFQDDRDFREVLTARYSYMNGPAAQFYRTLAASDCCNDQLALGGLDLSSPDGLVDVAKVPTNLLPFELDRWVKVPDRGPRAAGILTLPAFLAKYGTRRGRANAIYETFLCRQFVADQVSLKPSSEPDLAKRPGCSTCHARLEPLAAYFTRTKESSFAWIPSPLEGATCALPWTNKPACTKYHDADFATSAHGSLRGAHASPANADKGPRGLAEEITAAPEFDPCVAKRVTEGFLGRAVDDADQPLLTEITQQVTSGGHRVRAAVRALIKSEAYKAAARSSSGGGR